MTTALEICQHAYAETNPGQDLTSFAQQDWPYSLAQQYLNKVISELNVFSYWFMETSTLLPYAAGVNEYNMTTLGINPKDITRLESRSYDGIRTSVVPLTALNYSDYTMRYQADQLTNAQPRFYSRYNTSLYIGHSPQVDYKVYVYHYAKIPKMLNEGAILPIPFEFEHVFQDGIKCQLLMDLSRQDAVQKYQIWQKKIENMAAEIEIDYAMPTQLPANF